jgi:hypothetical protein
LSALAAWNFKGALEGATLPELPLTSVSALFVVLSVSAILHLAGYWITALVWMAINLLPPSFPHFDIPLPAQPYETLWALITHDTTLGKPGPALPAVAMLALVIVAETWFAIRAVSSPLFDLVLEGRDTRGLGWLYQNITRPRRHGYQPFAYVLTTPSQGDLGLGYQGMVADIRQGSDGQLKSICLSEPQVFVYELTRNSRPEGMKVHKPSGEGRMRLYKRRWLGGVVALEAAAIRNIVVHHIPSFILEELAEELKDDEAQAEAEAQVDAKE